MKPSPKTTNIAYRFFILGVILLTLGLFLNIYQAESHEDRLRISRIVRVYDGDTIYVDIDGLPSVFGENIGVRIPGIDTPEMKVSILVQAEERACLKDMAKMARANLKTFLQAGVNTGQPLYIINPERDKYFRINGDIMVGDRSAKEFMLSTPYAKPYDGGTKVKWECKK